MAAVYQQASTSSAPSAPVNRSLNIPPRPAVFKHRRTCSASTLHIQTHFSRQQTIPTSHGAQDNFNPRFSQLFSTALGSPFLTTSDLAQTSSHFSLDENVVHARAPSPSPTADYSMIDAEEANTDMPSIARIPGSYPYDHRRTMSSSFAGLTLHSSSAWPNQRGRFHRTTPGVNGSPFTSFNHPTESVSMPNMSHHTNPFKTLLPRIWDVISSPGRSVFSGVNHNTSLPSSSSPSINSSPAGSPYPHSISLPTGHFGSHSPSGRQSPLWSSLSRNDAIHNGKGKIPVNASPYSLFASEPRNDWDYSELSPLDGEEGELIDDEACFVDVRAMTGVDILALLPPEVALHILQLICPLPNRRKNAYDPSTKSDPLCNEAEEESLASLRAIIACLAVSHTWRRLVNDNSVWHTLFLGRWDVDLAKADLSHVRKSGTVFDTAKSPPSLRQRPKKYKWKFKNRAAAFKFGSPTKHTQPPRSSILQDTPFQVTSVSYPNDKFPLQFDWKQMYKDRLVLEKRWRGIAYTQAQIPVCTNEDSSINRETGRSMAIRGGPRSRSLSPTLFLGGHGNMNLSASTSAIDRMVEGPSFSSRTTRSSGSELRPMSVSQTEPTNLHASIFAEKWEPKVMELKGHTDSVYCVEFDSERIITGSRDRSIMVWSLKTGKLLGSFAGAHRGSVLCLKFEKDWELKTEMDSDNEVYENEVTSHGKATKWTKRSGFMVSGSSDCTVCVWRLEMGEFLDGEEIREREILGKPVAVLKGHTGGVLDLRIDDKWIVSCSKDTVIRVWDRKTLTLQRMLRGHEGPVNALGLQDGRVVSASGDGKMILWDIESGERLKTFEGHDRGLACIEFKDHLIVSGSNDCKIRIWNAWTGECLKTIAGHNALVRALSFDPKTGRLVSASYDKVLKVWDLYSGKLLWEFTHTHTSHIFDVKFDVGRIVSTSHDQKICVLDFTPELNASVFM